MKAFKEIGIFQSIKFIYYQLIELILSLLFIPQLRGIFLELLGAKIGKNCIIYDIKFMNLYRGSISNLKIGNNCFLGNQVLFDLAGEILISDNVTISDRSIILTHTNVGFRNHPLQRVLPRSVSKVRIGNGVFIGVSAIILPSINIGDNVIVGAGSVVTKNLPTKAIYAGSPAKFIKKISL